MSVLPDFARRHYLDVLALWTGRDEAHEGSLAPHCRRLMILHPRTRRPFGASADAFLQLHQPTRTALEVLREFARLRMMAVNRVEVALDLLTSTDEDAGAVYEYLDRHLVQRWHGADPVAYVRGTRYTRRRRWGSRQLVMYADSRAAAKNNGQPTCHLELRASGAEQLRRVGLESPEKLLALDHDAFWRRFLVLEQPDVRMIGRQARGRSHAKRSDCRAKRITPCGYYDEDVRVGRAFLRAAASTERGPTAQDARDSLRGAPWLRPRTAFRRLNPEPFVPSAGVPLMKVSKADFPPPDTAVAAAGSNAINPCQKDTAHDN